MDVPSVTLKPIPADAPQLWNAKDFEVHKAPWWQLSPEAKEAVVCYAQNLPNSCFAEVLESVVTNALEALTTGPGFFLIRGFPVDRLKQSEIERAYLAFGELLGTLVGQDRKGSLITHIRDERLPPSKDVRIYQTSRKQDFHSDAADLVGLLCVCPAKSGGLSRILSSFALFNEMLARDASLTAELTRPFPWSRHTDTRQGESAYFELAPIAFVGETPRISVIPWFIRQSQVHASAPRLTSKQLRALDLMEEVLALSALQVSMDFRPGDLQLLNNTTVLHARDSYVDYDEPELRRHLMRVWLTTKNPVAEAVLSGQR